MTHEIASRQDPSLITRCDVADALDPKGKSQISSAIGKFCPCFVVEQLSLAASLVIGAVLVDSAGMGFLPSLDLSLNRSFDRSAACSAWVVVGCEHWVGVDCSVIGVWRGSRPVGRRGALAADPQAERHWPPRGVGTPRHHCRQGFAGSRGEPTGASMHTLFDLEASCVYLVRLTDEIYGITVVKGLSAVGRSYRCGDTSISLCT